VQADQPGFDLCAALSVVSAEAQLSRQLCTGALRVVGPEAQASLVRWVELQPLAATLQGGERLRLSLAAAAWPHLAVNAGDGLQPRSGPSAFHRLITLTLELAGARLDVLPLLPSAADGKDADLAAN
jgi:predicted acyl esterase